MLIGFSLMTILLAAYAVMPKIPLTYRHTAASDVQSPQFNVLFFGDFCRLTYTQFETEMERVMNDPSLTYQAQVREIYTLALSSSTRSTGISGWPARRSSPGSSRVSSRCCSPVEGEG